MGGRQMLAVANNYDGSTRKINSAIIVPQTAAAVSIPAASLGAGPTSHRVTSPLWTRRPRLTPPL